VWKGREGEAEMVKAWGAAGGQALRVKGAARGPFHYAGGAELERMGLLRNKDINTRGRGRGKEDRRKHGRKQEENRIKTMGRNSSRRKTQNLNVKQKAPHENGGNGKEFLSEVQNTMKRGAPPLG